MKCSDARRTSVCHLELNHSLCAPKYFKSFILIGTHPVSNQCCDAWMEHMPMEVLSYMRSSAAPAADAASYKEDRQAYREVFTSQAQQYILVSLPSSGECLRLRPPLPNARASGALGSTWAYNEPPCRTFPVGAPQRQEAPRQRLAPVRDYSCAIELEIRAVIFGMVYWILKRFIGF